MLFLDVYNTRSSLFYNIKSGLSDNMRLINTRTRGFEEFIGRNIPKYAILSHTWEEEEVSFADYVEGRHLRMKGFAKINMTCQMAAAEGLRYVWVDTCCIDKRSSAELTEAINSMFRWYQRAEVCYAFLSDLAVIEEELSHDALKSCRWFTRGWTLQELIAPRYMKFFNLSWDYVGSKDALSHTLSDVTMVSKSVLSDTIPLAAIPVAEKMSWAAGRTTTRIEDIAYCLLGLFDVNLPLMYGEEGKAFQRLQAEVIKQTPDLSIFAWILPNELRNTAARHDKYLGVLAETPDAFSWRKTTMLRTRPPRNGITVSTICVKIEATIHMCRTRQDDSLQYVLPIHYGNSGNSAATLGIQLRKVGPDEYLRSHSDKFYDLRYNQHDSVCRGTHQLLLRPPIARSSRRVPIMPSSTINEDYVSRLRPRTIRFRLGPGVHYQGSFPTSRYDHRDHLFFVSDANDTENDWGILRLSVETPGPTFTRFVVYAAAWAGAGPPQCSLVYKPAYEGLINSLQLELSAWDHNTEDLLDSLRGKGIPNTSQVILDILGTNSSYIIAMTCTERDDVPTWMPRGSAWDVHITCSMHHRGEVPIVPNMERW